MKQNNDQTKMAKILIVEDSGSIREEISYMLKMEAYEVIEAKNGLEGIELAKKELPDLIISDISMPHMDGYEFLERLKEDFDTQFIPFVFLTAKVDKEDIRSGMNIGADDYITKPFLVDDILSTVKARLDKKAQIEKPIKDLKFNIRSRLPKQLLNPLNSITGYSYVMKENFSELSKDDLFDMIESIHASSLSLSKLVENYLYYTDLEVLSKPDIKKQIESDNTFKIETSSALKKIVEEKESDNYRNNEFEKEIKNLSVRISPDHFNKSITELLDNAIKHSPKMSRIKIRIWMEDVNVNFSCTNPYRIISIEQMAKIQNCLTSESSYKKNQFGCGLSIVKKIADLYGGSFEFKINESPKEVVTTLSIPK